MWWVAAIVVLYVVWQLFMRKAPQRTPGVEASVEPLYMNLDIQISGAPDQVSGYLHDVADRLQHEVDSRKVLPREATDPIADAIDPLQFRERLRASTSAMAVIIGQVERAFEKASASPGDPEAIRLPYATLLNGLLDQLDAFRVVRPPSRFANAYDEYVKMLRSMYDQLTGWPSEIRNAASAGTGLATLHLSIRYDTADVERAIEYGAA